MVSRFNTFDLVTNPDAILGFNTVFYSQIRYRAAIHQKPETLYISWLLEMLMSRSPRRDLLKLSATSLAAVVAGCNTGSESAENSTSDESNPRTTTVEDVEALQETIDDLNTRVSELEDTIEDKNATIRQYETSLETKEQKLTDIERRLNQSQVTITELEDIIESQNQELTTVETKLEDSESRVSELQTEVEGLETEIERLEQQSAGNSNHQYSQAVRSKAQTVGKELRKAVVYFDFEYTGGFSSAGTGWFIDDHHIVSNAHVLRDFANDEVQSASAYLLDGKEIDFTLTGIAEEDGPDISLVETSATAPYTPPRRDSSDVSGGTPVVMVGHPSFIGNWVISLGEAIETNYVNGFYSEIPSKTGNSGSPIVTLDGEVIALNYGSSPRNSTEGTLDPVSPDVFEEYPYQERTQSAAVTVETVGEYYQRWI